MKRKSYKMLTIQVTFLQSLVSIRPVACVKYIEMLKVYIWQQYQQTQNDDNTSHDLWVRWAKNNSQVDNFGCSPQ